MNKDLIVPVTELSDEQLREEMEKHGLLMKVSEARKIVVLLDRNPTIVEAHLFNTTWSEHCSYKSSKEILKKYLPTNAPNVILGPEEDAGIIELCVHNGERYGIVIGHESHNHPSQVVPNEGAATGIGGVVRDVYCMGAEVVGVCDPLRFGDPDGEHKFRVREIANGVVEGIWQYANPLGVPNLGGDVFFDKCYDDNCLVNVVAIGVVKADEVIHSKVPQDAKDEPYVIVLVGKPTDDSGFGGAAFASVILDEEADTQNKGAVQVPDPFLKRVLSEANKEVLKVAKAQNVTVGFKDLGAGGIAGVTSEICAAADFGVIVNLDDVPVSIQNLRPEVIACSETQERYAWAVPKSFVDTILKIYNEDFELPHIYYGACATVIGEITAEKDYILIHNGEEVCRADVHTITSGIVYNRPAAKPTKAVMEPVFDMPEVVQ